jgi:hypothetical protein
MLIVASETGKTTQARRIIPPLWDAAAHKISHERMETERIQVRRLRASG